MGSGPGSVGAVEARWRLEILGKGGDALSGCILKLADSVAELKPLDDPGQAVLTVEFAVVGQYEFNICMVRL